MRDKPALKLYGKKRLNEKELIDVAPQFNFEYIASEGCNVSTPEVNGINVYNKIMESYLESKNGEFWKLTFNVSVDSLLLEHRADTIKKIILAKSEINDLKHFLDSIDGGGKKIYIEVLKKPKNGVNVIVAEKISNNRTFIWYGYYLDPYTLKEMPIDNIVY